MLRRNDSAAKIHIFIESKDTFPLESEKCLKIIKETVESHILFVSLQKLSQR